MAIRFKYGGVAFTADTPEEAAQTMTLLKERDAEVARQRAQARLQEEVGGQPAKVGSFLSDTAETPWTPVLFQSFIDRLGESQQNALKLLVSFRHITDGELRATLDISGNQALAGVLSGISKQAAALNIPARAVFSFENFRNGGTRRSNYKVAEPFLEIATKMNWPNPQEFPYEPQS
jgi:hypothetical protein